MAPKRLVKKERPQRGHNVLGSKIRAARLKARPLVTQADLAARLAVGGITIDRPTITRIENGQRYLRDYEVIAIAKALRVRVSSLWE